MTIYKIKDLIQAAKRLPLKWQQSFLRIHEDIQAQLQIWAKTPEALSKDESTHAGIKLLAKTLLGDPVE